MYKTFNPSHIENSRRNSQVPRSFLRAARKGAFLLLRMAPEARSRIRSRFSLLADCQVTVIISLRWLPSKGSFYGSDSNGLQGRFQLDLNDAPLSRHLSCLCETGLSFSQLAISNRRIATRLSPPENESIPPFPFLFPGHGR